LRIVVDSYAWIELFLGSAMGSKVRELVESAEQAFTPDSVLAELSRKYFREGVSEKLVRERLASVQGASEVVVITPDLAVHASKAALELVERAKKRKLQSPGLFDGLVLGTARLKDAKVVTADAHFKDLPETIWI
jgi:predicted nucleic acid-binding protein